MNKHPNNNFTILVVDDVIDNIKLAISILESADYQVRFATNGQEAIDLLEAEPQAFDFILLDIMMPVLDGFATCRQIKANPIIADIPVIFVTAKSDGQSIGEAYSVGGIDYITKPFYSQEILMKLKTHIELLQAKRLLESYNINLEKKLSQTEAYFFAEIEKTQRETFKLFSKLADFCESDGLSNRYLITDLAVKFANLHPNMTGTDEMLLRYATPLYDIGKVCKYNETHEHCIRSNIHYTQLGYQILKSSSLGVFKLASIIAKQHLEHWDGSGMLGLKHQEIKIHARVVAISVVIYDLLFGTEKKQFDEVVIEIKKRNATQFDPDLVSILTEHQQEFKKVILSSFT